ncbi:hypothetical protein EF847_10970 [Actinobacteria bacterium YIM 96077]|uniref:Uncharacterized protein n=2 Tax=Phytoactinopolyspora halophila TaxID=1981511 RepID=A0A329R3P5_9ACTN|nr:hypothetical protein EF847_10970 [Actinobacteria bacterium YIM 96077]RAW17618.1 hypothetical protein DPM12_06450 [Phytoactinopolyspora halophila]
MEEELKQAMRAAASTVDPPIDDLVAGGMARGRRMRRRYVAKVASGSVAIVVGAASAALAVPQLMDRGDDGGDVATAHDGDGGVAADDGDDGRSLEDESTGEESITDSLSLPVEEYMMSVDEGLLLRRAHDQLVQECMQEQGFAWEPPRRSGLSFASELHRRYAFVYERDVAREHGYQSVTPDGELMSDPPEPDASEEERHALGGSGPLGEEREGCLGDADTELAGDATFYRVGGFRPPEAVDGLGESYVRSREDERVQEVIAEWSACMAEEGHGRERPGEFPTELDINRTEVTPEEIEIALADVRCQERTGLVHVWFEVESEIQAEMIEADAETFARIAEEKEVILRRAAEILESDVDEGHPESR